MEFNSRDGRQRCSLFSFEGGRISTQVRTLWTLLSLIVTSGCLLSLTQPHWFVDRSTGNSLGLYNHCVRDAKPRALLLVDRWGSPSGIDAGPLPWVTCGPYGGRFDLASLPSNAWQVACVLYGGGCALMALSTAGVCALIGIQRLMRSSSEATERNVLNRCVVGRCIGCVQAMAAALVIASLFVLPFGLDSKFVQLHCPHARIYYSGLCYVGWPYTLAAMSSALSLFSPFLAHYLYSFNNNYLPPSAVYNV